MAWRLRRAGTADLDAIMAIETATFVTDAWSARSMRAELRSPHGYYLVATRPETPDVVDGYAGLSAPAGSPQADVQTIAVAEHARRTGLGRLLMHAMLAAARDRGAGEVFLEVRADNPAAQSLYSSLGFERIGIRRAYYQPDGVDALVMRAAVHPGPVQPTSADLTYVHPAPAPDGSSEAPA
jgi:ribosomal-protein-alanine N-acetyltransferase